MGEEIYKAKYLLYKQKYLDLKNLENKINMKGGGEHKQELILFKADWCGHCKNFKPVWEKLTGDFNKVEYDADKDKSIIARYKEEGFPIQGYPTIMLKDKKTNTMVEYNGNRDESSLLDFVNSYKN